MSAISSVVYYRRYSNEEVLLVVVESHPEVPVVLSQLCRSCDLLIDYVKLVRHEVDRIVHLFAQVVNREVALGAHESVLGVRAIVLGVATYEPRSAMYHEMRSVAGVALT